MVQKLDSIAQKPSRFPHDLRRTNPAKPDVLDVPEKNLIAYTINGSAVGDSWKTIAVLLNGTATAKEFTIPTGNWKVAVDGEQIEENGLKTLEGNKAVVPGRGIVVLFQ